ncbi:hypothetical protein A0H81_05732 [Grifola frondosa]|uniref:Uncharacterized protein n=1 Tax=Grifola frondosa TaxID=5627 RepID=A0A1C7MBN7_GRIFR|nr:hypothetical protein A0H81_05732 [Grifola frondosa]
MTWVLGWPFTIEYAREYIREHRLLLNADNPSNLLIIYTAYEDIDNKVNDDCFSTLVCWLRKRLASLLKAEDAPKWYRYSDGSYTPSKGELCVYPDDDNDEEYSDDGQYSEGEYDEEYEEGLDVVDETTEEPRMPSRLYEMRPCIRMDIDSV